MKPPQPTGRDRVGFLPGARLTAGDLEAASEHERRLRALHIRALHDTWGIALGYEVSLDSSTRQVRIGPGLAYDCDGSELISADSVALPSPAMVGGAAATVFDLVLAPADGLVEVSAQAREAACVGGLPPQSTAIRWERAGFAAAGDTLPLLAPGIRLGRDIPLGRFVRASDGTLAGPDVAIRRRVRPLLRPHIGMGQVTGQLMACDDVLACTMTVQTTEAGFSEPPQYFVSFVANPFADPTLLGDAVGPFLSVTDAKADEFTLQLIVGLRPSPNADTTAIATKLRATLQQTTFSWIGLEPFGGCPPPPHGRWFRWLDGRLMLDLLLWPDLFAVGVT